MAKIGTISWVDLTVPDAGALRDFYRDVVGWTPVDVEMGAYNDYCMNAPGDGTTDEQTVAGICHARGANASLPPQWLVYINVADLQALATPLLTETIGKIAVTSPSSTGLEVCAARRAWRLTSTAAGLVPMKLAKVCLDWRCPPVLTRFWQDT